MGVIYIDPNLPQTNNVPVTSNPVNEKNTGMAIVAYVLFFVPLLAGDKTPFVKYHTNQGLILFLFSVGVSIVSQLGILGFLAPIGWIITLVLVVVGIINAANGEMKPLPVIGQYQLLK